MADYLKGLFAKREPAPQTDDDFADFAEAPPPKPASVTPAKADPAVSPGSSPTLGAGRSQVVYTKWYRVWERTQPGEFTPELVIMPFMFMLIALHYWGRTKNRGKARAWLTAHASALEQEYAQVGFQGPKALDADNVEASGLAKATDAKEKEPAPDLLKEKSAQEFATYATGRQNVAFTDVRLTLYKRYNPATWAIESLIGYLFESQPSPQEKMDITSYAFDGQEKEEVPTETQEQVEAVEALTKGRGSTYDAFVWAVVHKEHMKRLRDERYDVSLTITKDHEKLPNWCVVMSESAEITEKLLTNDLTKNIKDAGHDFQYLIVTDQPIDRPAKLDDAVPRKRATLSLNLPSGASPSSYDSTLPLFKYFLRLPDLLVSNARFRPEITKKIKAVREEEEKKISKLSTEEKAEERRLDSEKKKKELRDAQLRGMSAEEQRKYLEKEREKAGRKQEKKMTRKVQG